MQDELLLDFAELHISMISVTSEITIILYRCQQLFNLENRLSLSQSRLTVSSLSPRERAGVRGNAKLN
jgi:hypothetical protein